MNPKSPVFPNEGWDELNKEKNGISVRDYIAIEAMKALIPVVESQVERTGERFSVSEQAYIYADALIVESNKK